MLSKLPRWRFRALIILMAGLLVLVQSPSARATPAHEQIKGSGSSWAYNSVQQWISDVQSQGLQIVYTPTGSAQGRRDFANGVTDFAVSDIGYQGIVPETGVDDVSSRPYAYLPVVGGGTSFPYHITVGGKRITNLRLSQQTLADIFCNQITNWDDPHITADNNGRQLPSIPIVPVVHSEGAGTTYQVTDWLDSTFPSLWHSFTGYTYPVEYWPSGKGAQIPENGSDNVMSFLTSSAGQGSIGFDEYSYALQAGYPVANVENAAGYYIAPDQYNVAVALTQAQINMDQSSPDYLLENLSKVWAYNDPRTYPLSSYSYFIEPTAAQDPTMDSGKRQTIVQYLTYSLCQGQAEMGPIGYSPLPVNLVQASFEQLSKLHQADSNVSLESVNVAQCNNPTFDPQNLNVNRLAQIAPQPPLCDKVGQGPCQAGTDIVTKNPGSNGQVPAPATPSRGGTNSSSSGAPTSQALSSSATSGGTGSANVAVSGTTAPSGPSAAGVPTSDIGASTTVSPQLVITTLAAAHLGSVGYGVLAGVLLLLAVGLPPFLSRVRARRGSAHR